MDWKKSTGAGISIAVLDSGIDVTRKEFANANIKLLNNCVDNIGHGTAVSAILTKLIPEASIHCYNIFEEKDEVDCDDLIEILNIVSSSMHFNLIHLSCGITTCSNTQKKNLYKVCKKITDSGTILVAAFDNAGEVSYPAAFDNVIGVDWCPYCASGSDYYALDGGIAKIMGTGSLQRLPWKNNSYRYVAGSSFATPYITGIIAKMLCVGISSEDIFDFLKYHARKNIKIDNSNYRPVNQHLNIKKAIIFPFNKEIQTLSAFEDMLSFTIEGIYDSPFFGHVGKKCRDIVQFGSSSQSIKSLNEIPWSSDFDTIILGHVDVISAALKRDFLNEFLHKCIEYEKNIYAFDDLRPYKDLISKINTNGNFAFFPRVDENEVDKSMMGKLYSISTPVVAIFGTSPKQGKFSLQLMLRRKMQQLGYRVGGLGTEPSSLLFGLNRVYPIGYGSTHIGGSDAIQVVNRYMHEIDCDDNDIIIVGSQSQTIPYNMGNIGHYPLAQHDFLIGTAPDAIILCVNPFDDVEYIRRTINYLESYIDCKVLALVLFPKHRELAWAVQGTAYQELDPETINERKMYYREKLQIPCYTISNEDELEHMVDYVTDYFV